jgi:hypothetical protein
MSAKNYHVTCWNDKGEKCEQYDTVLTPAEKKKLELFLNKKHAHCVVVPKPRGHK